MIIIQYKHYNSIKNHRKTVSPKMGPENFRLFRLFCVPNPGNPPKISPPNSPIFCRGPFNKCIFRCTRGVHANS